MNSQDLILHNYDLESINLLKINIEVDLLIVRC